MWFFCFKAKEQDATSIPLSVTLEKQGNYQFPSSRRPFTSSLRLTPPLDHCRIHCADDLRCGIRKTAILLGIRQLHGVQIRQKPVVDKVKDGFFQPGGGVASLLYAAGFVVGDALGGEVRLRGADGLHSLLNAGQCRYIRLYCRNIGEHRLYVGRFFCITRTGNGEAEFRKDVLQPFGGQAELVHRHGGVAVGDFKEFAHGLIAHAVRIFQFGERLVFFDGFGDLVGQGLQLREERFQEGFGFQGCFLCVEVQQPVGSVVHLGGTGNGR